MKITQTEEAPAAIGSYSQAVSTKHFLFLSGQIPLSPQTGAICGETMKEQAEQVMKNISSILKANKLGFQNVVKTTCYLSDMEDFKAFNEVYGTYFIENPARSCIAVKELLRNVLCEVEVIAANDSQL